MNERMITVRSGMALLYDAVLNCVHTFPTAELRQLPGDGSIVASNWSGHGDDVLD
jgi:hypothetical protein